MSRDLSALWFLSVRSFWFLFPWRPRIFHEICVLRNSNVKEMNWTFYWFPWFFRSRFRGTMSGRRKCWSWYGHINRKNFFRTYQNSLLILPWLMEVILCFRVAHDRLPLVTTPDYSAHFWEGRECDDLRSSWVKSCSLIKWSDDSRSTVESLSCNVFIRGQVDFQSVNLELSYTYFCKTQATFLNFSSLINDHLKNHFSDVRAFWYSWFRDPIWMTSSVSLFYISRWRTYWFTRYWSIIDIDSCYQTDFSLFFLWGLPFVKITNSCRFWICLIFKTI